VYLVGQGANVMGPGTAMVQRIDWSRANETQLINALRGRGPGLGSVPEFVDDRRQMSRYKGMGCGCKQGCGLGLFETGLDVSGWSWPEYALVALGGYMLMSTVFTTGRAARRIAAIPGERRKSKAKMYRLKAAELSRR